MKTPNRIGDWEQLFKNSQPSGQIFLLLVSGLRELSDLHESSPFRTQRARNKQHRPLGVEWDWANYYQVAWTFQYWTKQLIIAQFGHKLKKLLQEKISWQNRKQRYLIYQHLGAARNVINVNCIWTKGIWGDLSVAHSGCSVQWLDLTSSLTSSCWRNLHLLCVRFLVQTRNSQQRTQLRARLHHPLCGQKVQKNNKQDVLSGAKFDGASQVVLTLKPVVWKKQTSGNISHRRDWLAKQSPMMPDVFRCPEEGEDFVV